MKRHITIVSLVLATAMLFTACHKDENGLISLNVELGNYTGAGNAKMYVDDDRYTHWTSGDQVKINNTACSVDLSGSKAKITGVEQHADYKAIYPAGIVTGANTINLPAEQVYTVDGENQVIVAPMAAYTTGNTLSFTNLCALIRVDVTNNDYSNPVIMESITVTSSSTNLCGNGTIDFDGTPTLGALDGGKTVTLTFDGTTTVSKRSTKSFYIYVPQFSGDISITVRAMSSSNFNKFVWNKTKTGASLSENSIGVVPAPLTNTYNKFYGTGTEGDPFLIYNLDELRRVPVNSAKYFKLMNDINCGDDSWTPIGSNNSNSFTGTFDGNGKTITYKINHTDEGTPNLGFFGHTSSTATIKNLKVSGSIVSNSNGGYSTAGLGSIVGYCNGSTIQNCFSNVNMTSTYTGTFNVMYGGIVGYLASGSVSYCFVSGAINGNGKNRVGGIVGHHGSGTITHCTFEGTVSGGTNVGMIVGNTNSESNVTNCHYYVANKASYTGILGKGTGSANGDDIAGTIKSDKTDLQTYVSGISGYDIYTSSLSSRLAEL